MPSEVSKVVQRAGLIEDDTLRELRKWGSPVPEEEKVDIPPEIVPNLIERAMQEEEFVRVRETDLEVLQEFLSTQHDGLLVIETMDGSLASIPVTFGRTTSKQVVIPWFDDDRVSDIMGDCIVTLVEGDISVLLSNPRELYLGERKMFSVWEVG